ncbi:MAG: hypothetical protein ACO3YO_07165 [Chthoniobacterales bacterium]
MKKWIAGLVTLPMCCWSAQAEVGGFDDIHYWVGSGQNRAALVLQWNDGLNPVSVAWGYRWDGDASGIDMLRAIAGSTQIEDPTGEPTESGAGADDRLALGLVQYSFGLSVLSLEYAPTPGSLRTQSDWFSGYWEYLIRGGSFEYYDWVTEDMAVYDVAGSSVYDAAAWSSAPIGASDRTLIDGSWDAYSFAPGFVPEAVQQPVAAKLPVPAASCMMGQGKPNVSALSKTGFLYQLEYSENMAGPWQPMGDSELGTGGELVFQDETLELPPQRFYRITVRQAP